MTLAGALVILFNIEKRHENADKHKSAQQTSLNDENILPRRVYFLTSSDVTSKRNVK